MIEAATYVERNALQIYRKLLLDKKAELLGELAINSHELTDPAEKTSTDPGKLSQQESVSVLLNLVLYGQLREVGEALERLDLGNYGLCMECGGAIAPKRLQAVPWTRYCLLCQKKAGVLESHEAFQMFRVQERD